MQVLTFKKLQHVNLFFVNVIFLRMDYTVPHIWNLDEEEWRGNIQDNVSARKGCSEDKVNNSSNFFYNNKCDMSYLLDKCTLDKMRERSIVIKILVPYSDLNS